MAGMSAAEKQLIKRRADLDVPREPSVCGIDGSYQLHRLTSMDLCAAAAVAVDHVEADLLARLRRGEELDGDRHEPEGDLT